MTIFKKGELKLLWAFYIYLIFWTFSLMIQPYTFIYFRNQGFSFTQIASFTSVMMVSLFVFEVPTGIVADIWGRKRSVLIGLVTVGISPIIIVFSKSYYIILFCYILIGLGITFISGAEEALIVDNLKFHQRDDLVKEYYIKLSSFIGLGTVVSYGLGSIIVNYFGIKPLWFIWSGGYLLSALLLQLIQEHGFKPYRVKSGFKNSFLLPVKRSVIFINNNKFFFNYLIGSSMITILFVQKDLWNVFLVDNGIKESRLSIIALATSFIIIFLPWLSKKIEVKSVKYVLVITTIIRIAVLVGVIFIKRENIIWGIVLFIILGSINSFESPITSTYVQNEIESDNRATMGSFMNMIYSVVGAVAGIVLGLLSDFIGIQYSIVLFSLFGFISLYFYLKISPKLREEGDNGIKRSIS